MRVFTLLFLVLAIAFDAAVLTGGQQLKISKTPQFQCFPPQDTEYCHVLKLAGPVETTCDVPFSLTAVLDRSGSMEKNQKLQDLKTTMTALLGVPGLIEADDYIGAFSFNQNVNLEAGLRPADNSHKGLVTSKVNNLIADGRTNIEQALCQGVDQQSVSPLPTRYVLLLTDGKANEGETDINVIVDDLMDKLNIPNPPIIHTAGYGGDHEVDFLTSIANAGGGSYFNIATSGTSTVIGALSAIIGGIASTTARNIEVKLIPQNGATINSVQGGTVTQNGLLWTTFYPDLFAGEQRDLLICLDLPSFSSPRVLSAEICVDNPCIGQRECIQVDVTRESTCDSARLKRSSGASSRPSPNVDFEVVRLRFRVADDIEKAVSLKQSGNSASAVKVLQATLRDIDSSPARKNKDVVKLRSDVLSVLEDVDTKKALPEARARRAKSGTVSLRKQRGFGESSFVPPTPAQRTAAKQVADFAADPPPPSPSPPVRPPARGETVVQIG